ncbi:MAG: TRAP transporter large permease [Clostridium sp.]|nr:TRAP transporter large permease [Clostridium sp.]
MGQAIFLAVLVVMFLLGIPVVFSLGLTAIGMMIAADSLKLGTIVQQMINGVNTFTILAVPLFLLAGKLMNSSGTTDRLFNFAMKMVGWLPGGLGHVNILASVIFAGMSGTAISDASGLGVIEIKAMKDVGFDDDFSCCVTAASSTVGPIIPPSLPLVVYGTISGASVGALFVAGIIPGVLIALLLGVVVLVYAVVKKYPREKFPTARETVRALKDGFLPLMAPVIILVGIYTGIYTPTESAAIVVFYSLFLGFVVYKELNFKKLKEILIETMIDAATIGMLVAAATLFGTCIIRALIPQTILSFITSSVSTKVGLIIIINVFLLVVGMFMETTSAITILMPIMIPLVKAFNISLVQFGIIVVLNLMIGVLTPPFGLVLFVTSRIGEVPFGKLCRALIPWLAALLVALALVSFVPDLSLWLPRTMGFGVN